MTKCCGIVPLRSASPWLTVVVSRVCSLCPEMTDVSVQVPRMDRFDKVQSRLINPIERDVERLYTVAALPRLLYKSLLIIFWSTICSTLVKLWEGLEVNIFISISLLVRFSIYTILHRTGVGHLLPSCP